MNDSDPKKQKDKIIKYHHIQNSVMLGKKNHSNFPENENRYTYNYIIHRTQNLLPRLLQPRPFTHIQLSRRSLINSPLSASIPSRS